MPTVRRDSPPPGEYDDCVDCGTYIGASIFVNQCILDLAAGRHAKGCRCTQSRLTGGIWRGEYETLNACLHIAACARDLVGYDIDVEVGDASDTKPESL